jgi:hypothetical protein
MAAGPEPVASWLITGKSPESGAAQLGNGCWHTLECIMIAAFRRPLKLLHETCFVDSAQSRLYTLLIYFYQKGKNG